MLIDGLVIHKSEKNLSPSSRFIYTFRKMSPTPFTSCLFLTTLTFDLLRSGRHDRGWRRDHVRREELAATDAGDAFSSPVRSHSMIAVVPAIFARRLRTRCTELEEEERERETSQYIEMTICGVQCSGCCRPPYPAPFPMRGVLKDR